MYTKVINVAKFINTDETKKSLKSELIHKEECRKSA